MEIFYDGQCPFCRSYVGLLRLRSTVGKVELIDARSGDARLAAIREAGLGLDEGMVVRHGGRFWHGAEAVWLLSTLSEKSGVLRGAAARLLRDPGRARLLYPWLATGRRLVLRMLGRKPIGQSRIRSD